ncbi:MAG: hypothetical protein CMO21_11135 [Thioclava sp.]|nr:hypothetical protein [Thioclava sp.]|tara:strand:- start:176 stop:1330 length:1155 start_codon:yes stop_codon:yes gene_type:complete
MKKQLSKLTQQIEQATSIKYNNLVYELKQQGKDVTVLSLGEAYFDIPLKPFDTLPFPQIYHYSHSRGLSPLREKLANFFSNKHNLNFNPDKEILVTAGSKAAIYMTLQSILNPGENVLVPEPAWVSYTEQIKLVNGTPNNIPINTPVSQWEKFIDKNTKAIIICNPHNPTGYVYSKDELNHILELAQKHNFWVMSDEAYSEFVDTNSHFLSFGALDPGFKNSIVFNSISKNFGISGWRIGYVISNEEVVDQILKVNQHIITCPPTILLYYIVEYFEFILEQTGPQIEALLGKRQQIMSFMDQINLKYCPGNSTFYFFVNIQPSSLSSDEFCQKLLIDKNICAVPGIGYGQSCDSYIRISIGTESLESIQKALVQISELVNSTNC